MGWFSRRPSEDDVTSKPKSPFPAKQMFILALCRICEPIAYMSIFPYVYYMIQHLEVADTDDKIATYAGMVTSAFAFAEFSCAVLWGRLSDIIGRKPVLLIGLAGTGISMLLFGLATNFPMMLIARALGGILNGNIGVIQTTVAEVVRGREEHRARAFSVIPFVWTVGGIIGSSVGGLLAMPVQNYPDTFKPGTVWDKYPFLLPNLVCGAVTVVGVVFGLLFLEETHEHKLGRRDIGLEVGEWLTSCICLRRRRNPDSHPDEHTPLLREPLSSPKITSTTNSRASTPTAVASTQDDADAVETQKTAPKPSFLSAFTPQVILQICAYGFIAFHTATFGQLFPILLSMPHSHKPVQLPFYFTGGFDMSTKTIGMIYALQGIYNMFVQIVICPIAINNIGTYKVYKVVLLTYAALYFFTPYTVLLSGRALQVVGVGIIVVLHITYASLAYLANALLLAEWAPSLLVLGSINGVAASMAALCRACGPTVTGYLQSLGLKAGVMGAGWWAAAAIALLGAIESLWLRNPSSRAKDEDDGAVGDGANDDTAQSRARRFSEIVAERSTDEPMSSAGPTAGTTLIEDEEIALLAEHGDKRRNT